MEMIHFSGQTINKVYFFILMDIIFVLDSFNCKSVY